MVAHRGLREPDGGRQFADACLAVRVSTEDAQQPESRRVGQDAESGRQSLCFSFIQGFGKELGAALGVDRLDELHDVILTAVDTSVNVSTLVYARGGVRDARFHRSLLPRRGLPTRLLLDSVVRVGQGLGQPLFGGS